MRIREIRVKINREKFSEAIDLAQQTLVTMGPDTDLTQLLDSAQVEEEVREKKREQERTFETIRSSMESGRFDDATLALEEALKTNVVEAFDPRIQRLSEHIKEGKTVAEQKSAPTPPQVIPQSISREYAFLPAASLPSAPEKTSCQLTSAEKALASELTLLPQPVAPAAPLPSAPASAEKTSPQPTSAEKASANELAVSSQTIAPVAPLAVVQPRPATVVLPPPATIVQRAQLSVAGAAGKSGLPPYIPARHRKCRSQCRRYAAHSEGANVPGLPKGDKTKRVKNATVFHLAKLNSGTWGHHGCSVSLTETPMRSLDNLDVTYKLAAPVTSKLNPSLARN